MFRQQKTRIRIALWIFVALFVLITATILIFSGFSGETSGEQSAFVANIINDVLRSFGIALPRESLDLFAFVVRKLVGHFLIFLLDGLFAYLALWQTKKLPSIWLLAITSSGTMLSVAGVSELIQLFTSGRSGNWGDVGIDLCGALAGIAFAIIIASVARKK